MAAFNYIAIDSQGKQKKGVLEGDSARQIRQRLREMNLNPVDVSSVIKKSEKASTGKKFFLRKMKNLNFKELALLTRQIATLLGSGLPVEESLRAVAEQAESAHVRSIVMAVRARVVEGYSLASGFEAFPKSFSSLYCATVGAGEQSGHLDAVLNRLADYTEQQQRMRQKIQSALIYPAIMTLVSIAIVGFLLTFVVPKMVEVFHTIGQSLPVMTEVLISISHGIKTYGLYVLVLLIIAIFSFRQLIKRRPLARLAFHNFLLKMPVLSKNIKMLNTARFSRTFAILSGAGVPILEAMSISSQLVTNIPIRRAVVEAAARVREGANIHLSLKQTGYFPPMSLYLIASGEASGQLEAMLTRAANNQDEQVTRLIDTALTLFEPIMILVMGAVVLFIVLAIMLPIFSINQMV